MLRRSLLEQKLVSTPSATRKCIEDLTRSNGQFLQRFSIRIPSILLPSLRPTDCTWNQPGQMDVSNEGDDEMEPVDNEEEEEQDEQRDLELSTAATWPSDPRENRRRPGLPFRKSKALKLSLCSTFQVQAQFPQKCSALPRYCVHAMPLA